MTEEVGFAAGRFEEDGDALPPLRLPANLVSTLLADTISFGRQNLETGGFLLTDRTDTVRVLAVGGQRGVERGWGRFTVSGAAMECVCEWAANRALRVAALVHTHKRTADMSRIDRESGFRVEGFRSVIIPTFANPPLDPSMWGWYMFRDLKWVPDRPAEITPDGHGQVVVIDEQGPR